MGKVNEPFGIIAPKTKPATSPGMSRPRPPAPGGSSSPTMGRPSGSGNESNGPLPALGGLFAGGMPKLKKRSGSYQKPSNPARHGSVY